MAVNEPARPVRHTELNGYHVLDWLGANVSITAFWRQFPELIVGRYLVNTSLDSGSMRLSGAEIKDGWHMSGQLAHSPRIRTVSEVPHDQYDEWLVFEQPTPVGEFETLVNYSGFSPGDFGWAEKLEKYWAQIVRLQPLHVLGENEAVYLVTRDGELAANVARAGITR